MRKADEALEFLAETDDEAAQAKAYVEWTESKKKTTLATLMANLSGSIAHRKMTAEADSQYAEACTEARDAVYEYEKIRNMRKSAELEFEYWRTVSANKRAGQLV